MHHDDERVKNYILESERQPQQIFFKYKTQDESDINIQLWSKEQKYKFTGLNEQDQYLIPKNQDEQPYLKLIENESFTGTIPECICCDIVKGALRSFEGNNMH